MQPDIRFQRDMTGVTMSAPRWPNGEPGRILLATDLRHGSDRALDRAAALAAQWNAELLVLHVTENGETASTRPPLRSRRLASRRLGAGRLISGRLTLRRLTSWRRPPDPPDLARKRLLADLGAIADKATVLVGEGDPAEVILRTAETARCDLIVVGMVRQGWLRSLNPSRTVDRLRRGSSIPLLVAKCRPRGPYRHVVVAADFSAASRHAVEAAARLFREQPLTILHAYDAPMSGLVGDPERYRREYGQVVARECEAFLQQIDKPRSWQDPRVLIEHGPPTVVARDYVQDNEADLMVLGTHGRSAILEMFIGSAAKAIMEEAPCDLLIVQEPRTVPDRAPRPAMPRAWATEP